MPLCRYSDLCHRSWCGSIVSFIGKCFGSICRDLETGGNFIRLEPQCCSQESKFVIHLDQFLIHIRPIHFLNKALQDPNLNIYQFLVLLLNCISQLLARIGYFIELTAKKYVSKLYSKNSHGLRKEAVEFPSKETQFLSSVTHPAVVKALNSQSEGKVEGMKKMWDDYNVKQLNSILNRFSPLLCSRIAQKCYTLFCSSSYFDNDHLKDLVYFRKCLKVDSVDMRDELCRLRTSNESFSSLSDLFYSSLSYNEFANLCRLIDGVLLICPNNMSVEKGFSEMKMSETIYQNQMSLSTYNAIRTVKSFYDPENFEETELTSELMKSIKSAASSYRKQSISSSSVSASNKDKAENMRHELDVFERHTPHQLSQEQKKVDLGELCEQRLQTLKRRKAILGAERAGATALSDSVLNSIIDSWMPSASTANIHQ